MLQTLSVYIKYIHPRSRGTVGPTDYKDTRASLKIRQGWLHAGKWFGTNYIVFLSLQKPEKTSIEGDRS